MRTIAIANQKGGSGKTTTTVNLGAALAELGRRVLLVDFDPQATTSRWLGEDGAGKAAVELLEARRLQELIAPAPRFEALDLLPTSRWLGKAERWLGGEPGSELILRENLAGLAGYDYVFVDCQPAVGFLTYAALMASEEVLVPVEASTGYASRPVLPV